MEKNYKKIKLPFTKDPLGKNAINIEYLHRNRLLSFID